MDDYYAKGPKIGYIFEGVAVKKTVGDGTR